jgi:shikimate kinase
VTTASPGDRYDRRHVALVGLSGTGKSTLAPLLAEWLEVTSADVDGIVADRRSMPVADIFAAEGEAAFREAESAVLAEVLGGPPAVVATGGGAVLAAENRRLLAERCIVVWLRADPEVLAQRLVAADEERPLLAGDAVSTLRRLATEREAHYREVADLAVDADDPSVDPDALADRIAAEVRRRWSVPDD